MTHQPTSLGIVPLPAPAPAELLSACLEPVAEELLQVEQRLEDLAASTSPIVRDVLQHMLSAGGKRLRPALVLLAGRASGASSERLLYMAAAVEIVHVASMIHDDVVDEADLRRGRPTVNARWCTQVSVLAADYLVARLYGDLARRNERHALDALCRAVGRMCDGELAHLELGLGAAPDEEAYFGVVRDKTGALMSACCDIGAHTAGAPPPLQRAFRDYGESLGAAFQIADDILDLVGEPTALGKPVCNDLTTGHLTLPLIHALHSAAPDVRDRLRLYVGQPRSAEAADLAGLLERSGSLAYARAAVSRFADQACAALPALPPSRDRQALADLTHYVALRGASSA